jgi:FMN phosphatase YigB (HAD superfamily)
MSPSTPDAGRTLLVTDLDNTLWDWFEAWYASFSAMLTRLSALSGVPQDVLEPEIRRVHQAHGTAEYSHLLNELPSLREGTNGQDPLIFYDEAVHIWHSARKKATRLYPGVVETMNLLRTNGVLIVAYTESLYYWTEWRMRHTGLDGLVDVLYSSPDHDLPAGVSFEDLRRRPAEDYGLRKTQHRHVPKGMLKPNAEVLRTILEDCERDAADAVFVGDSLMKDIAMAQSVGVLDAWAKYGKIQDNPEYDLLRRVSHWPDADVARERTLNHSGEISPTVTLRHFGEVATLFGLEGVS